MEGLTNRRSLAPWRTDALEVVAIGSFSKWHSLKGAVQIRDGRIGRN